MKYLHESPTIIKKAKVIQIICGALILGVVIVLAMMFLIADKQKMGMSFDVLTLVMAGMAAMAYLASFLVPMITRASAKKKIAAKIRIEALQAKEKLDLRSSSIVSLDDRVIRLATEACQANEIVRAALVQGGAMGNAMIFLVEPSFVSMIVAGFGILLMIAFFPTSGRIVNKIEYLAGL